MPLNSSGCVSPTIHMSLRPPKRSGPSRFAIPELNPECLSLTLTLYPTISNYTPFPLSPCPPANTRGVILPKPLALLSEVSALEGMGTGKLIPLRHLAPPRHENSLHGHYWLCTPSLPFPGVSSCLSPGHPNQIPI